MKILLLISSDYLLYIQNCLQIVQQYAKSKRNVMFLQDDRTPNIKYNR